MPTNNITPITKKSAKAEKTEEPATKPAPKPSAKKATNAPHAKPKVAEPTAVATIEPAVDEPTAVESVTEESLTEQPSEAPAEPPAEHEEKVFGPIQIRKLAREKVWFIARKHHLPMVKPGAKDAEGYVLSTDDVGGTVGRVLVTYLAPSIEDADERRKFVIVQIEKVLEILRSAELEVVRANIEGTPYITVPTTRVPGKADEPAKRGPRGGKSATWSLPLTTVGEEQGSGI